MTERRIIKETLKDGEVQYRVEVKMTAFGYVLSDWHTDDVYVSTGDTDFTCSAVFHTLAEAQIHCGQSPNPIVKREIIKTE